MKKVLLGSIAIMGSLAIAPLEGKTNNTPSSQAFVFYTQPTASGCLWQLLDPHTQNKRTLYKTPECPDKIVWDSRHRQTFYTLGTSTAATLYRMSWQDSSAVSSLGPRGDPVDLWISRDSQRLRRVLLIETTTANTLSKGGTTYFLYKGGQYPTEGLTGDGTVGMAVVEEQSDSHTWTVVGARNTTWDASDSMGTSPVEKLMEKDALTATLQELLQKATCAYQQCPSDMSQAPAAVKDQLKALFPGLDDREGHGLVYVPLNRHEGLFFSTEIGDTVHAGGPVYYCRQQCRDTKRLGAGFEFPQMSVSTQSACALLTEEYTGNNAAIICAGPSAHPYKLKESHSAIWFPFPELWTVAKSELTR